MKLLLQLHRKHLAKIFRAPIPNTIKSEQLTKENQTNYMTVVSKKKRLEASENFSKKENTNKINPLHSTQPLINPKMEICLTKTTAKC